MGTVLHCVPSRRPIFACKVGVERADGKAVEIGVRPKKSDLGNDGILYCFCYSIAQHVRRKNKGKAF